MSDEFNVPADNTRRDTAGQPSLANAKVDNPVDQINPGSQAEQVKKDRKKRARELDIKIGRLEVGGPFNAITDVPGVRVGHTTLFWGDEAPNQPLAQVGKGAVRTGVTVVLPHGDNIGREPVFAGYHVLNGNGEMTGMAWLEESGLLTSPIAITNTHSVGVVRDALISYDINHSPDPNAPDFLWSLPVVAETWDGFLSDINGMHVLPEHVWAALDNASDGPVQEGCVGGGTGMICHGFKGGIGTSSRKIAEDQGGWTVGVLVQANYGQRHLLHIDGVPVGRLIPSTEVPLPGVVSSAALSNPAAISGSSQETFASNKVPKPDTGSGSIIVIIATNAPLLPMQCRRLAQRATIGIARVGGLGENSSGDLFLAFSTANRGLQPKTLDFAKPFSVQMISNDAISPLFEAVAEATEEAIVNALCAAVTTTGKAGRIAYALPQDRLTQIMADAKFR